MPLRSNDGEPWRSDGFDRHSPRRISNASLDSLAQLFIFVIPLCGVTEGPITLTGRTTMKKLYNLYKNRPEILTVTQRGLNYDFGHTIIQQLFLKLRNVLMHLCGISA